MKKIIIFLSFAFAMTTVVNAQSQSATTMNQTATNTTGTYSNSGADTTYIKAIGNYASVAIQGVVTKVSGTAAGTGWLYGSLDGVNYEKIASDSLKVTNTSKSTHIWVMKPSSYLYYKTIVTGTGTMSASYKSYFLGRQ